MSEYFRMVTVVGTIQNIYKAFLYIGKKLETVWLLYNDLYVLVQLSAI